MSSPLPLPGTHPFCPDMTPKPAVPTADWAAVKLLVLDVDGVLTDGGAYYTEHGLAMLRFSIIDGLGLVLLQRAGVKVAIMSASDHAVLRARVDRLGVKLYFPGVLSKGAVLPKLLEAAGVAAAETAYMSDDINDVSALTGVALPIAVANAQPQVIAVARHVTANFGGHGAVREVCNAIMAAKGFDPVALWEGR